MITDSQCMCKEEKNELKQILGVCLSSDCIKNHFFCIKCQSTQHQKHPNFLKQSSKILEILAHNVEQFKNYSQSNLQLVGMEKTLIQSQIENLENLFDFKKQGIINLEQHIFKLRKEAQFYDNIQQIQNEQNIDNKPEKIFNITREHLNTYQQYLKKNQESETELNTNQSPDDEKQKQNQIPENEEILHLMNQGFEMVKQYNHWGALNCFNQVIEINPKYYQAYMEKAQVLLKMRENIQAIFNYDIAISLNKYSCDAYVRKILALGSFLSYEAAIECYNKAAKVTANNPKIKYFQLFELNLCFRRDFEYVLDDNSDANDTQLGRIRILQTKNNTLESLNWNIRFQDQQIQHHGKNFTILVHYLFDIRFFDETIKYCDQMLLTEPNNITIYLYKGSALYNLRKLEEAILILNKALEIEPNNAVAIFSLGLCFFSKSEFENSVKCYDKALQIEPKYALAFHNKGRALHQLKRFKEALQQYEQAQLIIPQNKLLLINKGSALHKLQFYNEAINCFDEVIRTDSENALALHNKGLSLYEMQFYKEALAYFDQALEIQPNFSQAYFKKGMTLHKLLKYKEAIKLYNISLYYFPDNALVYKKKADAQFALNKFQKAIKNFKLAFEKGWGDQNNK